MGSGRTPKGQENWFIGFWEGKGRETQQNGGLSPVLRGAISFTREEVAGLCRGGVKIKPRSPPEWLQGEAIGVLGRGRIWERQQVVTTNLWKITTEVGTLNGGLVWGV